MRAVSGPGHRGETVHHLINNNANRWGSLLGPVHTPRLNPENQPHTWTPYMSQMEYQPTPKGFVHGGERTSK